LRKPKSKRRIAVFGNGFNGSNLGGFIEGLTEAIPPKHADFFLFMSHAAYGHNETQRMAENSIFDLPDLKTFDAAIIYGPGLNFVEAIEKLCDKCAEAEIPTVAVGIQDDRFSYVAVDNYTGMYDLVEHLIEKHNVKNVCFIAGSMENEDSNARLQGALDALSKHNLELKPENLHYSNWSIRSAADFIGKVFTDRKPKDYPDAFITANDMLAMFAVAQINKFGFNVPDDFIVSGFDATSDSQVFYPSIATVDQNQKEIGKTTAEALMNQLISGEKVNKLIKCSVYPGESCGCEECRGENEARRSLGRHKPEKTLSDRFTTDRIREIEKTILQSDRYSNLAKTMQDHFNNNIGHEGPVFYWLLDSKVAKLGELNVGDEPKFEYASRMDVVIGRDSGGHVASVTDVGIKELLPEYYQYKDSHDNTVYILLPSYLDGIMYGYSVFGKKDMFFEDEYYYSFHERLICTLEAYKKNLQLTNLYDKLADLMHDDPLTHVRNRVAYEKYKSSLEEKMVTNNECDFAIILFDINNLKMINDNLGHELGDEYIKNCCKLICTVFKHSPVFRIGGDEFVAVLKGNDYNNRGDLLDIFRSSMEESIKNESLVERVSIACGMAVMVGDTPEALNETFRIADERMYMNKAMMKKQMQNIDI